MQQRINNTLALENRQVVLLFYISNVTYLIFIPSIKRIIFKNCDILLLLQQISSHAVRYHKTAQLPLTHFSLSTSTSFIQVNLSTSRLISFLLLKVTTFKYVKAKLIVICNYDSNINDMIKNGFYFRNFSLNTI